MADTRSSEADRGDHGPAAGLSDDAGDPLSAPTAVKAASASTARRIRTDSNATQREAAAMTGDVAGSSFTPRGHDSPLARRLALAAAAAAAAAPTDAERPSLSRQSTVGAGSSRGRRRYDRTTTRNLIHGAASDGDLVRLQALLATDSAPSNAPEPNAPDEEEASDDRPASTFALANEPNPHSGLAPVHLAAQNGHEDAVKWLVEEAGALPDLEDAGGETPLHKAALRGHLDVCRFLLSRQVDINAADNDGWTPLHNAASRGWLDVAQLLTTFRADPDVQNRHGFTPLMNAASKGHLPLVHFLLRQAGAEPLRRNIWGETAFDLAASVFELEICRALAAAEERAMLSESATPLQTEASPRRRRYNPLALHATVPVVLYENQRLVTPSMRRPASLVPGQGDALSWSSGALTRNDQRLAFFLPDMLGFKASEAAASGTELPCFKSEVGLPVVGKENELVLPRQRQVRSSGRVQAEPQRPRPTPRRSSSRSSVSGSAASPPSTPSLDDESTSNAVDRPVEPRPEPAWMWISEWTVDRTSPTSSPIDGWSYAPSFDTPAEEWTAAPPTDASGISILSTSASGARKWVRRRLWTRVLRRRVDLPDWGFDDGPQRTGDSSEELQDLTRVGYRARARYFAGEALPDLDPSEVGALDNADHRKAIAQLERAIDELRQGLTEEADETRRREAQAELEEYLRLLAPLQSRDDGSDGTPSEEAAFVYSGVDAAEDDARSIWTSMRSPSVASSSAGGRQLGSRTASFQSTHSNRPVLTAQSAPEFRIPTNELAAPSRSHASPQLQSQSLCPPWEPDHATNACRRCSKHFSLLIRRHHCRRCGLVVCSACSPHSDRLDPRQVAIEPGTLADDSPWLLDSPAGYRYRTCNDCHAALALIPSDQAGPSSLLSPQAFFPASPSLPGSAAPSEAAASDVSELAECPVCGETLAQLGDKNQQEGHIRECLEAGKGTIASGRYLLFRLPPGPLVGADCNICWTEFEIGDKMARLVCLCTFHEKCLSGWLARGNSCPVHALRE